MEIKRNYYLQKLIDRKNNGLIKIITGIRRCGKSYLLNHIFKNYLLDNGVDTKHIIMIALDDVENAELLDPKALRKYINEKILDNNLYYLLLDEIQLVQNFEGLLNGLLRKENLDIYVTGSNSKFLSSDIITEFRGRGDEIRVYPLSFNEFYSNYDGSKEDAWVEYYTYGGLPLVTSYSKEEDKMNYLEMQKNNVYLNDVIERNHIKNKDEIEKLIEIDFIANKGNNKFYIQFDFNDNKCELEIPFLKIKDFFKRIIIVKDNIKRWRDDKGIVIM